MMRLVDSLRSTWRRDRGAIAVPLSLFALSLFVYTRALSWGLPSGDETWAADAIRPTAPLAVAWQNFGAHGFNSGWFWFKYPPFHAFLLCALYAPYLAWLWATGGLSSFQSDWPFGMADPVASLSTLALIGRAASAAMGAGCVLLVHACTVRSFGRASAASAAFVTALAYPMVFYSQTTNVEVPYLFWMLLALLGAVRLVEGDGRARWWVALGAGAALSVSTKELAAGAFVLVPVAVVGAWTAARRPALDWIRGGLVAGLAFAAAMAVANNALWNPQGFVHRIGFLTQTLPREVALQYAPYYFPIELGGNRGLDVELAQGSLALRRLVASLGWPTALLSLAGWALAARRRPAWAALLGAVVVGYYVVSVRAMLSLSLRYLLPMTVCFCVTAGVALGVLLAPGRAAVLRRAAAAAAFAWAFAYGWDVNRMMTGDGRYGAEAWLASAPRGTRVEIYQNRTYLPRFPEGLDVTGIDYEQRGIGEFLARKPDLVVLSSSGLSGVTVRYKQDWQADEGEDAEGYSPAQRSAGGQVMNFSRDANVEFLAALTAGRLGYEKAASHVVRPWIERPLIQSLNPEITIYRRSDGAAPVPVANAPGAAPDAPH